MSSGSFKNVTYEQFIYKSHLFDVYMYEQDKAKITYKSWYAIKHNLIFVNNKNTMKKSR